MLLYPAIDLMSGEAVRLRQGLAGAKTVYSRDPVAVALEWEARGGDWLHVVDLDAAFGGESRNLAVVRRIAAAVRIPVELGGGMRDEAAVQRALDAGVRRVVLGTRAAQSVDFPRAVVERHGAGAVAVGIDARDGLVAVKGWTETTALRAVELARRAVAAGVRTLICTDIATDGMLAGPNFAAVEEMVRVSGAEVIASGGVSGAADLVRLQAIPGLHGAIIGKALFDGLIQGHLREAMAAVKLD